MSWSGSPYEATIWSMLMRAIGNEYGVAGLMGNLYAESGLYALIIERSGSSSNPVNIYYAEQVNNGTISKEEFASYPSGYGALGWYYYSNSIGQRFVQIPDYGVFGKGWGLAQWTTADRKRNFYDRCFPNIGSIELQVNFLVWELQNNYPAVWRTLVNAQSINEASDYVLTRFEQPPEETWESEKINRRRYSVGIFEENTGRIIGNWRHGAVRDVLRRLIIHA